MDISETIAANGLKAGKAVVGGTAGPAMGVENVFGRTTFLADYDF